MQRILTAAQMREADRITIEQRGVPGMILMENAAARVRETLERRYAPLDAEQILILCGKGNNGGDGLALARQLSVQTKPDRLDVVLFAAAEELSGDAATNYKALQGVEIEPHVVTELSQWTALRDVTLRATVVVDALLGTGLAGAVRGLLADVIADLRENFWHADVVAVDIPSGASSDDPNAEGICCRADVTVTFTAPKPAQVLAPSCERMGELVVGRIGTADSVLSALPGPGLWLSESEDFEHLFEPRAISAHKGSYGHVAVVGGSRSKPGSVAMAGKAALRIGAGLATVVTARGACGSVVALTPELMTEPADELEDGSMGPEALRLEWFERATVLALGPGLGASYANQALARKIVAETTQPLVIDADGLRIALAEQFRAHGRTVVLTPHPGEMAAMTGLTTAEVQARRVELAREVAIKTGAVIVLKGARSLIASPGGDVFVNPTGSPAMATAGSGDILSGMIAGLLAQFPKQKPEIVVAAAVFVHGRCGEIAAERRGEQGVLATDLLEALPAALGI